jgi:hypothetical protein
MKLQVTIGTLTVNTTPSSLGRCFNQEDTDLFNGMLTLAGTLRLEGEEVSQYVDGIRYGIRCIK